MAVINIGSDFSRDPAGRGDKNGKDNGKAFRETVLKKAVRNLHEGEKLVVILDDDVDGYGSSFLSEGFGGMVKCGYIKPDKLLDILVFKYKNPDFEFFERRIKMFIKKSKFNSSAGE